MFGYKAFNSQLKCLGFQYQEGLTYKINKRYLNCKNGFDFCDVPYNLFNYCDGFCNKYAIIHALGKILVNGDKLITNKIKIVKVLTTEEFINEYYNKSFHVYTGEYHFKNGLLHRDNDLPALIKKNGDKIWCQNDIICRENDLPSIIRNDGTCEWYENGVLHRDNDLPAKIYKNGNRHWYKDGLLHRDNDLPAISENEYHEWNQYGKIHRDNDLPAVINENGDQYWYLNGRLYRENDKPAIIYKNGDQFWYHNSLIHRNNKPAIIFSNGEKHWYENGKFIK